MRVCYFVLAVAATLFASSDAGLAPTESNALLSVSVEGIDKRSLRSYNTLNLNTKDNAVEEERTPTIDPAKIQKLLNADDIAAALGDIDKRVALFTKWLKDDETTLTIVAKLSEKDKIIANMPILTRFNDVRTTLKFNQQLTEWLDTKLLDEIGTALQAFETKPMRDQFTTWYYNSGITPKEFPRQSRR